MECSLCGSPAVVHQRSSGRHLCRDHLLGSVESRVRRTLREDGGLPPGSRLAVGLSGGKDSSSALHLLHSIYGRRPGVSLVAVTVDEGIESYRPRTLESARALAGRLGVEHRVVRYEDVYGVTMDRAVEGGESHPCGLCGPLRGGLLVRAAREMGATHLATGHNLDDEAQTILMNVLRGDAARLLRGRVDVEEGRLMPRVKPLRGVPEKEVALYALLRGLPVSWEECPYASGALRSEVRGFLNRFEVDHPGAKYAVVRGFERAGRGRGGPPLGGCVRCGEPSSGELCNACRVLVGRGFARA